MQDTGATMRSAAHDIRGYLASASLATEHLSTHGDAQVARRAEWIAKAIDQVIGICQSDLAEMAQAPPLTAHSAAAIKSLLEQIRALIAPQFGGRSDHSLLTITVADDVCIKCHQTSLFRILYNLTVNAARAVRAHSGSRVDLAVMRDGRTIQFVISDDGPGLPKHIIEHLYPRIDRPAPRGQRIGYGLMTAVSLAQEMQGSLHLIESGATGTKFLLNLPEQS